MSLNTLTIEQLLQPLPRKLQVRFALYCANQVRHLLKDKRSIKALDITQLWLDDKATTEDTEIAVDVAHAAAYDANAAAYTAAYAANSASYTIYAAYNAAYVAANSAAYAARALNKKDDYFKSKLIEMIKQLSQLERILYELKDI